MSKAPRISAREMITALRRAGFVVVRRRGSHSRLRHPDGRCTTVSVHSGETIGAGLFGKILRDCEMTIDDFEALM
jgi:predicted RNA binding protein YcfA (HicA-like mRNA interferase family)